MNAPQVIVTLSPEGGLTAELPGAYGTRRRVELRPGDAEATLVRILRAQLARRVQIGEDGAPTVQQVAHWERHQVFANPQCPFCRAENADIAAGEATRRSRQRHTVISEHGGVVVRRVSAKTRGRKAPKNVGECAKSAAALGL